MMNLRFLLSILFILHVSIFGYSQNVKTVKDTLITDSTDAEDGVFHDLITKANEKKLLDSLQKLDLRNQIEQLKESSVYEKRKLQNELQSLVDSDSIRKVEERLKIDSLRKIVRGSPVVPFQDTIFTIYVKSGSLKSNERSANVARKMQDLYKDEFLKVDSIFIESSEYTVDIIYGDLIITSVTELDAQWHSSTKAELAKFYLLQIKEAIIKEKADNSLLKLLYRVGLVILIALVIGFLIWGIKRLYSLAQRKIIAQRNEKIKDITIKNYTLISSEQGLRLALSILNGVKWLLIVLLLFLTLPLVFSVFPFTQSWAGRLFSLLWDPFKGMIISLWTYLPKLITIVIIYLVMRYFIRLVRYIFGEIELGKLEISGFHRDWAMPTFSIVKFLLYAFMLVLIYPFLPNSDSDVFKGVSVFIGILFSLGSSSAIANMVAGLVITYMRPFKIGDKIKTGGITGKVIEKTLLVTRLRTILNEEVTIPNAAVLSGNTINYSTFSEEGLILLVNISIGYDVHWTKVHAALLEAATKAEGVMNTPKPFVLQESLDDFFVRYVLHVYTNIPGMADETKSSLHQHVQDVCAKEGIEIMSPHYQSKRAGDESTIPKI